MSLTVERKKQIIDTLIMQVQDQLYSLTIQARVAKSIEDEQAVKRLTEELVKIEKTIDGFKKEKEKCTDKDK